MRLLCSYLQVWSYWRVLGLRSKEAQGFPYPIWFTGSVLGKGTLRAVQTPGGAEDGLVGREPQGGWSGMDQRSSTPVACPRFQTLRYYYATPYTWEHLGITNRSSILLRVSRLTPPTQPRDFESLRLASYSSQGVDGTEGNASKGSEHAAAHKAGMLRLQRWVGHPLIRWLSTNFHIPSMITANRRI